MRKEMNKNKIIIPIIVMLFASLLCIGISIKSFNNSDETNVSSDSTQLAWDENGDYYNSITRQVNTRVQKSSDLSGGESSSYADSSTAVTVSHLNENTTINGATCTSFKIGHGVKVAKKGEIFSNQNAMKYSINIDPTVCQEIPDNFVAFCLDPNTDGYYGNAEARYTAQNLSLDSSFGRYMYALYDVYRESGSPTDDNSYFAYMTAARILSYAPDSDYSPLRKTTKSRANGHENVYKNWGSSAIGPIYGSAAGLVSAARAKAASLTMAEDNPSLGLTLSSYTKYVGDKYVTTLNVMIENVTTEAKANELISNHNISYTLGGNAVGVNETGAYYDQPNNTVVITGELGINANASDCSSYELAATLKYNNPNDIRNAYLLVPSNPNDAHQRFIGFNTSGSGEISITNKLMVNMGSCEQNNCEIEGTCDCLTSGGLVCTNDDVNYTIINEGTKGGGETDWNACIIDKHDNQGNSYNIVDTSNVQNTTGNESGSESTGLIRDDIYAKTTYGENVLDANFCKISCKESYSFILPGNKQEIKQGTYFAFHVDGASTRNAVVGVGAERKCVTTQVKNDNFNKRAIDLRKQQIDYLNMYMYYTQLYNAMKTAENAYIYIEASKTEPYVSAWPSTSSYDTYSQYGKNRWNVTAAQVLARTAKSGKNGKSYKDLKIIKSPGLLSTYKGNAGSNQINIKYYVISNKEDLNATIDEKNVTLDMDKSFWQNFTSRNLWNVSNPSWYASAYSDYSTNIYNTNISVNGTLDSTDDEIVNYHYCSSEGHHSAEGDGCSGSRCNDSYDYCSAEANVDIDSATVTYYKNWEDDWDNLGWLKSNAGSISGIEGFTYYNQMLQRLWSAAQKAKAKYDSINAQIGLQADSIQECTNYLEMIDNYKYNPRITFSYSDQEQYMNMLAPNLLVNMNDANNVRHDYIKYYCTDDRSGDPESIFSCPTAPAEGTVNTKFEFGDIFQMAAQPGYQSTTPDVKSNATNVGKDKVQYNNVKSAGSRSLYGGYNESGSSVSGGAWPRYEFYHSAKAFYVRRSDGIVTVDKNDDEDSSILDTDGRVYPVAINTTEGKHSFYVNFTNIGQFFESGSLGRIMGGGDGKSGTMVGEAKDEQVCYYDVCRVDDPDCDGGKTVEDDCTKIIKDDCNNGTINGLTDSNYKACISKLLHHDAKCCEYVNSYMSIRTGKYKGVLPSDLFDIYKKECLNANYCQSFTIVTAGNGSSITTDMTDVANVANNGALQINARATSLSNLFPNNTDRSSSVGVGVNWLSPEAQEIRNDIEKEGDTIFNSDPSYSLTMNSTCYAKIEEYNRQQENSGGFNDVTYTVTDNEKQAGVNTDSKGKTVIASEEFRNIIEKYCDGKFPDHLTSTNTDTSKVEK